MSARARILPLLALALLPGCNDQPVGPSHPPEFRVSPTRQWSGGQVEITSPHFIGSESLPHFEVGGVTARAVRLNDSTVTVDLPALRSGNYSIQIQEGKSAFEAGSVELFGFRGARVVAPVYGVPYKVFQRYGHPAIVGGDANLTLRILDPASGIVTNFRGYSLPSDYGPSPSFQGRDVLVLRDSNRVAGEYRLTSGTLVPLDTVGSGYPQTFTRHLVPLRDDAHLITGSHQSVLYRAGQSFWYTTESVWGVFSSPTGHQIVLGSSFSQPGAQVFSTALADTVFTLPLQSVYGVSWPLDGSRIFASGGNTWDVHNRLMVLDAGSGQLLAEHLAPSAQREYWAIDASRDGSHLFVLTQVDSTASISVFEGTTLRPLATLAIPIPEYRHARCCTWNGGLALDEAFRKLYLVLPAGYSTVIYTFDLLVD